MPSKGDITRLLVAWSGGNQAALDELVPIVYDELRHLASAYMRGERPGHLLQTTALVNEAYLRLLERQRGGASRPCRWTTSRWCPNIAPKS
jgi:hypothetical protein